jgi:hypothetical protein
MDSSMCIKHITNLVWHQVKEALEDQSQGWCVEEEMNPMHEARGPRRRLISGADRLAV